jgi:aconitate hydratase
MAHGAGAGQDIAGARVLACSATRSRPTTSRRPATSRRTAPAGKYLIEHGVAAEGLQLLRRARGNHEVMMRGTFANIRLKNQLMLAGTEGGVTTTCRRRSDVIYDASMRYQAEGVPLVVLAGKEYGTGSSRDWAAKGTKLLGVKAVIAESFERIHRSNLSAWACCRCSSRTAQTLGLTGKETFEIAGLNDGAAKEIEVVAKTEGADKRFKVKVLLLTPKEVEFYRHGGLLHYVLRQLAKAA